MYLSPKLIMSFSLLTMLTSQLPAAADQWVTLAQSQPFVANSLQAQHTSESINLKRGQDKLQLFLTYTNGGAAAPNFKWLRIASSSMNYVTEKAFVKGTLTSNVTGELTWGGNQLLVSGAGPVGATLSWILRTPQPTVTSVSTGTVFPGNSITITGTNLCSSISGNAVSIGGQSASVTSASPTQLVVQVPDEVKGGSNQIAVSVAGINVESILAVNVTAQPYLTSLSAQFVAPGDTITIYGEGFSADASKDEVYIGPFVCPIVSASDNSLTVRAVGALSDGWFSPNLAGMGAFFPIKVLVNGVKSRNTLTVRSSDVG